MASKRGFFVVIEGVDGSGKTTQVEMLTGALEMRRERSCMLITQSEPWGDFGMIIRKHLDGSRRMVFPVGNSSSRFYAMAMAVQRAHHAFAHTVGLVANLNAGRVVLSDRYVLSSLVYQGDTDENLDFVREINKGFPVPDLTIYISVTAETAYRRITMRHGVSEIFDKLETLRVHSARYDMRAYEIPGTVMVDGEQDAADVHADILQAFDERYAIHQAQWKGGEA